MSLISHGDNIAMAASIIQRIVENYKDVCLFFVKFKCYGKNHTSRQNRSWGEITEVLTFLYFVAYLTDIKWQLSFVSNDTKFR